jgi:AbrB family looped-hinge helix DNA binding protein
MADTATLSSKFRISIPKAVRERQHWEAGQKLVFIPKGSCVLLVPAPSLDALRGIARGADAGSYRDRGGKC